MARTPQIKIRQLEMFDAVMKTGSTTAAAERLGVSQPAVSAALRGLEERLGTDLFDRQGRQLEPTATARLLAESTGPVFGAMEHLVRDFRRFGERTVSGLRIVAVSSLGHGTALTALRDLLEGDCASGVELKVDNPANVQAAVKTGQADLGLILGPPTPDKFEVVPLARTRLVSVVPRDHALVKRATLGPADMVSETLIGTDGIIGELVGGAFARQGVAYRPQIETGFAQTACAMVQAGLGVTVVDVFAAELYSGAQCSIRRFYPPTLVPAAALMSPTLGRGRRQLLEAYLDALRAAMDHVPSLGEQHRGTMYD